MSEFRKANVYVQDRYAGIISETDDGYSFQYDAGYVKNNGPAVSLTLPLQEAAFSSNVLFPFFDGLIPEGWLLDVVVRNWKLNPDDRFGLLISACRDCIGDVSIRVED